ncbi:MAG: glycosyltransferase family 4 protein [Jatrophihabitans sp.]|uniref:glycosyltransferase family 4 protein n=1 Tax=Jatrophihabitans sp. TaxID=1932789 RepID=UPI003F81E4B9
MRIALTSYRSKPHCGGQGVYVRHLSQALVGLGHTVEVFSGPPYPELTDGVRLTEVPSLDLYDDADPFRRPRLREFRTRDDVLEYAIMCTAGFGEPRTFSRRVVPLLAARAAEFDVVHDNQTFGPALLRLAGHGLPLVGTMHHPITVDRRLALAAAPLRKKPTLWRWYGFLGHQTRVARQFPIMIAPSQNSVDDAAREFGLRAEQLVSIPIGVDIERFRPGLPKVPGRVVAVCSADVPLKGLDVLLRALHLVPPEVDAQLVVVGRHNPGGPTETLIAELGIGWRVQFVKGISDDEVANLLASAEVLVVPSLYEGFSLPAAEAMASGTPVIAADAGALPEVVGRDGSAAVLVPPGDPAALARALADLLQAPERRAAMGVAARARAVERLSWESTARATAEVYRAEIARFHRASARSDRQDAAC